GVCVHCNTMEGLWSGLRNFLDRFKGISQRFLHLRVARYEFLHNHGHLPWRQTFEATLRSIFSTTGDYWRQMAHQHRRIPLRSSVAERYSSFIQAVSVFSTGHFYNSFRYRHLGEVVASYTPIEISSGSGGVGDE